MSIKKTNIELPKQDYLMIEVTINNEKEVYDIVKMDSSDKKNLYLYLQFATNTKEDTK